MSYVTRTCVVDGCTTTGQTRRGMCHSHYDRWYKATPPNDRRRATVAERFAAKTMRDPQSGCLLWTGALDPRGYGCFAPSGHERQFAHRIALAWKLGRPLLPGMFACHSCDTPGCVEPEHLFEGTHQQNVDDATGKQRQSWGARNGHTELTEVQVRAIREAVESGQTQAAVAKRYATTGSTISRIMRRQRWALLQ